MRNWASTEIIRENNGHDYDIQTMHSNFELAHRKLSDKRQSKDIANDDEWKRFHSAVKSGELRA
jgi:hypothetical protein